MKALQLGNFLVDNLLSGLLGAIGILLVCAGFFAVGRAVGIQRTTEAVLAGWGLIYLLSLIAALLDIDLLVTGLLFALIATISLLVNQLRPGREAGFLLMMVSPLLLLGEMIPPLYWDSYMHWLINTKYLFDANHFPAAPLIGFTSGHPTYPNALPLLVYFASTVTGKFNEAGFQLTNVVISALAAKAAANVIADQCQSDRHILILILALTSVLPLNPSFQTMHYWAAVADPTLALIVFILVARWAYCLCDGVTRSDFVAFFAIGCLVSGMKQGGWLIAVILSVAVVIVSLLQRIPRKRWILLSACFLAGAGVSATLWARYLTYHVPLADQFTVRPLAEWRFDLFAAMTRGMWADVVLWWKYYLAVATAIFLGFATIVRGMSKIRVMLAVLSLAMVAHLVSLVTAYLGTGFYEYEIRKAASLQRYSSQVGFALVTTLLLAASAKVVPLLMRFRQKLLIPLSVYGLGVLVWMAWPALVLANWFFTLLQPPKVCAAEAIRRMQPKAHIAVIAPEWSANFVGYLAWSEVDSTHRPYIVARSHLNTVNDLEVAKQRIREWMTDESIDSILLLDANILADEIGLGMLPDALWSRTSRNWIPIDLGRKNPNRF